LHRKPSERYCGAAGWRIVMAKKKAKKAKKTKSKKAAKPVKKTKTKKAPAKTKKPIKSKTAKNPAKRAAPKPVKKRKKTTRIKPPTFEQLVPAGEPLFVAPLDQV
jgi:hypothetical protein